MSARALLTPREQAVLDAVTAAARKGEPCPDNNTLACIIDCNSPSAAVRNLQMLEKKGVVKVVRFQRARQVTIVASGLKTAEPKVKQVHWRQRKKRSRSDLLDLLAEEVANGRSIAAAAREIGVANAYAYELWSDIKYGLGAQAV